MKEQELYYGFDSEKQQQYEKQLVVEGVVTQELMDAYKSQINQWSEKDKENFIFEGSSINQDLIFCINKWLRPISKEVQEVIQNIMLGLDGSHKRGLYRAFRNLSNA